MLFAPKKLALLQLIFATFWATLTFCSITVTSRAAPRVVAKVTIFIIAYLPMLPTKTVIDIVREFSAFLAL